MIQPERIVGLVPAAGQGSRISPLPMSKELFPLGFRTVADKVGPRPKVACHYLLDAMQQGGAQEAFLILRPGKWDIPEFLGDGSDLGLRLAYLTVHVPFGVPFSLNQAYPFLQGAVVVMGFPDILIQPRDAYQRLVRRLHQGQGDVVLGLFPTDQPDKVGVVDFDQTSGKVVGIYEKSNLTHLPYMWAIAAWRPSFSEFLHRFVMDRQRQLIGDRAPHGLTALPPYTETPIGDVIHAALEAGLQVEAEPFPQGTYLDIGTPDNLITAIQQYTTF
ncbi:sugar phosphate nucleotidyltransferase [Nodosilinea sp. P-1105]|uniref:nucleotidyltransferase family protein n=1 Tax=Nodosilinea sp. P-1105 TaxID=2546229 RepID=UPI00197E19B6|nr:sugar phosphate nucleotidyltransferase [Nodosilinea sp. P-1105]